MGEIERIQGKVQEVRNEKFKGTVAPDEVGLIWFSLIVPVEYKYCKPNFNFFYYT
jgi:hypothetical protein